VELRRAALALLVGVAVVASACSSASPPTTTPTTQAQAVNPVFADGGTVTVAVPYLPTNFNPSTPGGSNRVTHMVMEQVWPQAFVIDPQFQPETTGFIEGAEVVGLSPMTVSYQIDPKATWSDGYPITEADFTYNWQQQLRAGPLLPSAGYLTGYRDIKSISAGNHGKTVTVVFERPYSDWEGLFSDLVPAHIAERAGWVSAFAGFHSSEVISGGPFIISAVEPGTRLVLTRNPRYWGTPPHLRSIVFVIERSDRTALAALADGTVSIAEVTPGPQIDATIAEGALLGTDLTKTTTSSPVLWQLVFNLDDPLVGTPLMRKALALATDRAQLVADAVNFDDPLALPASSRVFAFEQPGSFAEAASVRYNPVEAATALESLGYVPDARGELRAYGVSGPLTLTITGPRGNGVIDALELQLQAEWASSGIGLRIHNVPIDDLLRNVLPRGSYQIALAPYEMPVFPTWNALIYTDPVLPVTPSSPPSLGGHNVGSSTSVASSGSSGTQKAGAVTSGPWIWSVPTPLGSEPGAAAAGYVNRDVTGLDDPHVGVRYEEIMGELNTTVQQQLLSRLDTLLNHDLPTLPLFQAPISVVQQADIVNVSESPTSAGPLWDAEDWAIELSPSSR